MTILGIDDTDSATAGMCTTYLGAQIAAQVKPVESTTVLVRLHPAIEHKTRGNGAVGIHTPAPLEEVVAVATNEIEAHAQFQDPNTNPGLVAVSSIDDAAVAMPFARKAIRSVCARSTAAAVAEHMGATADSWGNGRGVIGALAAVGATAAAVKETSDPAFDDWTYELLHYREQDRWGTPRRVDAGPLLDAAKQHRPHVWDTVDLVEHRVTCVPRSPCPVLAGIRGDDPGAIAEVASAVTGEPIAMSRLFRTNQGTDAHVRAGSLGRVITGHSYAVQGVVATEPENQPGGHVSFWLSDGADTIRCLAFEPTKRFRDHVRCLEPGDRMVAYGEVSQGALKLEKFRLMGLRTTTRVVPSCPDCDRQMKSAGSGQGYRCRQCGTTTRDKVHVPHERDLSPGWYTVPPDARRHLSKPPARIDGPIAVQY